MLLNILHTISLTHKGWRYSMWTLPRPNQVSTGHSITLLFARPAFRVPSGTKKREQRCCSLFWCERWDSNPHGETTRTSNVLVYHSNTLASDLSHYICHTAFCQHIFNVSTAKSKGKAPLCSGALNNYFFSFAAFLAAFALAFSSCLRRASS